MRYQKTVDTRPRSEMKLNYAAFGIKDKLQTAKCPTYIDLINNGRVRN